ncbi:MAG: hypothetical protein KAJ60_07940 [Desulfobulbaceae bacterium]|nr:hypothetical protein [Desulfobulbaceae bacterium]
MEKVTIKESATLLGVAPRSVHRYIKQGILKTYKTAKGRPRRGRPPTLLSRDQVFSFIETRNAGRQSNTGTDNYQTVIKQKIRQKETFFETHKPTSFSGLGNDIIDIVGILKEQLSSKDRQMEEKDRQISRLQDTMEKLTHQNEILTMLTQGIDVKMLMANRTEMAAKPGPTDVTPPTAPPASAPDKPPVEKAVDVKKTESVEITAKPVPQSPEPPPPKSSPPRQKKPQLPPITRTMIKLRRQGLSGALLEKKLIEIGYNLTKKAPQA